MTKKVLILMMLTMLLLVWLRSVKQKIQKQVEMDHLDLRQYLILLCFLLEGYSTASSSEL